MGPTPLTVGFRLLFKYTVNSVQHKQQNYLECTLSADPSLYDTVPRSGGVPAGVSLLADRFFLKWQPFFQIGVSSFDGWELQMRVGTTWVFVSAGATAITPSVGTNYQPANMICLSGKDGNNRNIPTYMFEGPFGTAAKINSYSSLPAAQQDIVDEQFNTGGGASSLSPWTWRRGRSGSNMSRWLSYVVDTNEKLRRIRHIK